MQNSSVKGLQVRNDIMSNMYNNVKAKIERQPASEARFRYESEGPTAGSIMGVDSTEDAKTYPAISIENYDGAARVVVSCVSDEKTPKPHPNCLIGAKWCKRGVYSYEFHSKSEVPTIITFERLGVRCAKKDHLAARLEEREKLQIDPFRTGFEHKRLPKSIDVHRVCLCYQVFLFPDPANPKRIVPLKPLVSDPIVDKQSVNTQLYIHEVSDNSGSPSGEKKMMLFCNKVDKKDIGIKFYEKDAADKIVWEAWASFNHQNVHKQVAIAFKPPRYRVQVIDTPVKVYFCLQTLKGVPTYSNSIEFQYVPDPSYPQNTKKRKIDDSRCLYEYEQNINDTNRQDSIMESKIHRNEAGRDENYAPQTASNFEASSNNFMLPMQTQPYGNINQHSHYEQQYQQSQTRQPLQSYNIKAPQVHHQNHFTDPQCKEYQPMVQTQHEVACNYGAYPSHHSTHNSYLEVGNVYGASTNFTTYNQQSQPIADYQTPVESSHHHSCQQLGQINTGNNVVIQQFFINREQVDILPNLSDYCTSSDQNEELNNVLFLEDKFSDC